MYPLKEQVLPLPRCLTGSSGRSLTQDWDGSGSLRAATVLAAPPPPGSAARQPLPLTVSLFLADLSLRLSLRWPPFMWLWGSAGFPRRAGSVGDAGRAPSLDVAGFAPSEASLRTVIHGNLRRAVVGVLRGLAHIGEHSCQRAGGSSWTFLRGAGALTTCRARGGCAVMSDPPPASGSPLPGHAQYPAFPCLPEAWASSLPQLSRPARSCLLGPVLGLGPSARLTARDLPAPPSLCPLRLASFSCLCSTFHQLRKTRLWGHGSRGP